jgi:hypothetical protein
MKLSAAIVISTSRRIGRGAAITGKIAFGMTWRGVCAGGAEDLGLQRKGFSRSLNIAHRRQ